MLALEHAAVVLGPKDAADHLSDAIYLGFTFAVFFALRGVVRKIWQGDV